MNAARRKQLLEASDAGRAMLRAEAMEVDPENWPRPEADTARGPLPVTVQSFWVDASGAGAGAGAESQRRIQRALEATPLGRAVLAEKAKKTGRGQS